MKKFKFVGIMNQWEYLNCSRYGNPRVKAHYNGVLGYGELYGKTATDASAGYCIQNRKSNVKELICHETATGNVIIDYVRDIVTINENMAQAVLFDHENGHTLAGLFLVLCDDGIYSTIDTTGDTLQGKDFKTEEAALAWLENRKYFM